MVMQRLRTCAVLMFITALASCRGGSSGGALPPVDGHRSIQSATAAPSVAQWTNGAAFAPSAITVSFPSAPAAGDVLVVAFWNNGQSSGAANTYTAPAGWTLADQNASHVYATYQVFSHLAGTGETNRYVFTPLAAQREHVWIAADVANATGVDRAGNVFLNNSASYTTPSLTPSQAGDAAIAFNLPITGSSETWTNPAGWTLGSGPTSTWHGEALYQSLATTAATSESAGLSTAATGFAGMLLLSPAATQPTPSPTPSSGGGAAPSAAGWTSGAAYAPSTIAVSWPAAPAAGDTLIVAFWNNGQSSGAANTYTAPAGWSLLDQNLSRAYATYQTFSHVVSAGESNKYVFTPAAAAREQAWIGVDVRGAGAMDKSANLFVNNGTSYTTPSVTPAQSNDLAIAFDLPMTTSSVTWTNPAGWALGTGPTSTWHGESLYRALSSTLATSESSTLSAAATGFSAIVLVSPSSIAATPPPVVAYSDWPTFGDDLARTQYNPNETTLSTGNVPGLKLTWNRDLGAAVTAQPVVATGVNIGGTPTTVAYVGTEGGTFYALNADTGATIWSAALASVTSACMDLPGGTFGITGTATFDKNANRIYVADGHDQVHALSMSTGTEAAGWPVTVTTDFTENHIYSGLALNPASGLLYVTTASYCDKNTWQGRIDAIDTANATIADTFFPATPYSGDGIWGLGGPAIDPANNVYIAVGNTSGGSSSSSADGDHLVELTSTLGVVAANQPGVAGGDLDFGASPTVYQPPGCPQLVSAKNKNGVLYTWQTSSIASGPIQSLALEASTFAGTFIGATTYSPAANLFYVGVPVGNSTFTHGIVALRPQSNCTLALAWQQTAGPSGVSGNDNDSVTVANGVAYLTDGIGNAVFAYDAATGTPLWNSGSTIKAPAMVSPTVDGRLFVSSWDHHLYAFGL